MSRFVAGTAAAEGLACCHTCLKVAPESSHECPRCGAALHLRKPDSLQRTAALVATAALLYIPANLLPIMTTTQLGNATDSTIIGGVIVLLHHGDFPIAAVIFIASVMVPISKLLALTYLCWTVSRKRPTSHQERTRLYRATELVGKWSMTDVFVVAILVALIHLGGILLITPGPAAIAFGGVVVVTMVAAESFDPRLIWDQLGDSDG
ncbi:MAG: paraquat-inducible protein A [Deltaproteobacteria bacterium]|nr:paraquat-inducible protein A [Deltaproteobacteria bacterium]MBW2447235.1 paraquat-inducible protein A [Deltaproteobacteria bacterium]